MSGTTKRTVSNKPIKPVVADYVPVVVDIPSEPVDEVSVMSVFSESPVIEAPKHYVLVIEDYTNWAIGEGINWKAGSIHEVDYSTFQRIKRDNPHCFESV